MPMPLSDAQARIQTQRRARLFDLYRSEAAPDEDGRIRPGPRDIHLAPAQAARLQHAAIASLSRGIPWPLRIFRRNRTGSPVA